MYKVALRLIAFAFLAAGASSAFAETVTNMAYCSVEGHTPSLRQTTVLIDGNLIVPEIDSAIADNQHWRSFAAQFVDATSQFAKLNLDPRERVTIAVSNRDGSGVNVLFSGCIPLFSAAEEAALQAQSSGLDVFIGNDWRSKWTKETETFKRSVSLALVSAARNMTPAAQAGTSFADGSLAKSLASSSAVGLDQGIPRIIIYTDLSNYGFPQAEVTAVRAAARADAQNSRADLQRAELHVLSLAPAAQTNTRDYLEAFFLTAKAKLTTLGAATSNLAPVNAPVSIEVYQGSIDMAETAKYPLRMRLARDVNGTVVNSWLEMQAVEVRFSPFSGILTCSTPENCEYVGDNIFAQIWSDNPDPAPECPPDMPFGGLRNLQFNTNGEGLSGRISDEVCFFASRENGLHFEMKRVANGIF